MALKEQHVMREYGSFKDSRRSPIHRWFAYPAGYSHKLVEAKMRQYGLDAESLIVDPFLGSGTTTLAAACSGIPSVGIEAHPFVSWVAKTKCTQWDANELRRAYNYLIERIKSGSSDSQPIDTKGYPALIYKCFTPGTLRDLTCVHRAVGCMGATRDFFMLALVASLRNSSTAGTGWPYIAPTKYAQKTPKTDAISTFANQCLLMINDVESARLKADASVVAGDSRHLTKYVGADADLIVTSPPYLNNYDYADRTRFETYFLGLYSTWSEITAHVRDALMTAATTQVTVSRDTEKALMPTVRSVSTVIHEEITGAMNRMSAMRAVKPGKKRYDLMTGGYFEDLTQTLVQAYDVMKPGGRAVFVLGDSAPYGVHVPTDILVGRLGKAVGFSKYKVEVLRARGDKWKGNTQRHHVTLRESITTLVK